MKYIFLVIFVLIVSGCSTTQPPVTEYRIKATIKDNKTNIDGCLDKSIKVAQAFSSSSLMSQDMNYGLGESKQFVYSQSQWADVPNRALTSEIVKLLREIKLFKNVQIAKSRSRSSLILETYIEDFKQYFNDDSSNSYANVVISLTILDSATNKVVASKTFQSRVDVKSLDASGGVQGLNDSLSTVLNKSAVWFEGVCK